MVWDAFTLAFFFFFFFCGGRGGGVLRCSEFTYPEVYKFCCRFDLSTVCVPVVPRLACPQQIVVTLRPSNTDSFCRVCPLLSARTNSRVCAVTATQLFASPTGPLFSFQSGRLLTRSATISLLTDLMTRFLQGFVF